MISKTINSAYRDITIIMERDRKLTKDVIKFARQNGIDIIGVANPADFKNYSAENKPQKYLNDCKAVIIVANYLFDMLLDVWIEDSPNQFNFHFLDSILEYRLQKIKAFLHDKGYISIIVPYKPGIFLKDAAVLAGLGSIGKNNLLLTEKFGSQVRLRGMVTSAPLQHGKVEQDKDYCKDCEICIQQCPASAFSSGNYDRELCLSYNLSNLIKITPYSSIWCNICIDTCPYSKKSEKGILAKDYRK